LFAAALIAATASARSDPTAGVSQARLHADVEALVALGTRHTLSVQDNPKRGIGAAAEGGPGPLVAHFSSIAGSLPCPLFVVPGGLTQEQIDAVS